MAVTPAGMRCSVIIATLDRVASLCTVVECLRQQTRPPDEVIISVSGDVAGVTAALLGLAQPFRLEILPSTIKSSAQQRNAGAARATGEVLAFLDDDIEFPPDLLARVLGYFERPGAELGGVSARLAGEDRRAPGRLTRLYYRIQSGYTHPDYGGRLFGFGINCYPLFPADAPELVSSEWLPSTCLFLRGDLFRRELFPRFSGYSYAEDVHLTARIARVARLFFASRCLVVHHSLPSEFKRDPADLIAGKLGNMRTVARDILGLQGWTLVWHGLLHRCFMSVVVLRGAPGKWALIRGIWRVTK
jgi:glycosyltransferase involved in cell wall biosynthesis